MFKNPFSFEGRIRRLEYGLSYLIYLACYLGITFLSGGFSDSSASPAGSIIGIVLWIPLLWFLIAQGAKRCHDRDNSGWFQIIPFYGLWMLFADGFPGENRFGLNPKGIGNDHGISSIGEDLQ